MLVLQRLPRHQQGRVQEHSLQVLVLAVGPLQRCLLRLPLREQAKPWLLQKLPPVLSQCRRLAEAQVELVLVGVRRRAAAAAVRGPAPRADPAVALLAAAQLSLAAPLVACQAAVSLHLQQVHVSARAAFLLLQLQLLLLLQMRWRRTAEAAAAAGPHLPRLHHPLLVLLRALMPAQEMGSGRTSAIVKGGC